MEDEEYKGYTISISQDDLVDESPLEYTDVGITYMASSRYTLGNVPVNDPEQWRRDKVDELKKKHPNTAKAEQLIEYPVYAYIHSGIALSLGPFSCPWDSGQSGVIFISRHNAKKAFPGIGDEGKFQERVREYLKGCLESFNQYISGEIYYYNVEDEDGDTFAGCGGFYGYDHEESGLLESARGEIDAYIETQKEKVEV